MKKNFFPMALMAIAMGLNACSSDDPVVNAGGGNVPFAEGGYVKMAINMPSAPSSRVYSETFGDGLKNEYEVKNATLILFEGTSENTAKFHSAYDLPVSMTKDGNTQITSTTKIVKKVDNSVPAGSNLYGYVLLNHNGLLSYSSATDGTRIATTLTVDGMALNDATSTANNKTFKDFREKVIEGGAERFNTTGFLMDNAPLSSEQGGNSPATAPTGTVENQTLVNLTNKVYKSQAEAEAKPATDVYVERALAKVTMTKATSITNKLEGSDVSSVTGSPAVPSTTVNYTIEGWTLDVTNKKSYLGRSCKKAWNAYAATGATAEKYRFVGSNAVGSSTLYRTYWGIDPNYDSYDDTKATENFTYLNAKPATGSNITTSATYNTGFDANSPLYCMENTFDVANMQDRQITRAIVKVQFFDRNTFYTFNDDKSTLYDEENMKKHIKQIILSNPAVLTKLATDFSGVTIDESNIELTFEPRDKDGKKILKSYKVTEGTTVKTYVVSTDVKPGTSEPLYANLNQELQLGNIVEYKDGIAYYPIRIKHFGDEQTPWDKTTASMTNPYGTTNQAENFLGRYGVLRNNWYNIEISSIKNVGSAVVPEIELGKDTSGDKPENYISVRINVLSWAKRTQSEIL